MPSFPKALQRYGFFPNPQTFQQVFSPQFGGCELSERNQTGAAEGAFGASTGGFGYGFGLTEAVRLRFGENEIFSREVIFYAVEHVFGEMWVFLGLMGTMGILGVLRGGDVGLLGVSRGGLD